MNNDTFIIKWKQFDDLVKNTDSLNFWVIVPIIGLIVSGYVLVIVLRKKEVEK